MLRRVLAALILFVLLAPLPGSYRPRVEPPLTNDFSIIPMEATVIGARFGVFTLAEAWSLKGQDNRFGGFSGMRSEGPRTFMLVSDVGYRLRFTLSPTGALSDVAFLDLPPVRQGLDRKRFVDGEGITGDPATGRYWVVLEGIAQIWRFDADDRRKTRYRNPVMFKWPANGGTESLARLPGGRFIALSERTVRKGKHEGVLFSGEPGRLGSAYFSFFYDAAGLGSPTDIAALPDGRILILHRKMGLFPFFTSHIALADPRGLRSGAVLHGKRVATLADKRISENYEGMVVERGSDGLSLWLVSDDNQNNMQSTRLLRFRIDPDALEPAKRAVPSPGRP